MSIQRQGVDGFCSLVAVYCLAGFMIYLKASGDSGGCVFEVAVAVLESVCTGQVYLPTLALCGED